jgi:hypothetical protein
MFRPKKKLCVSGNPTDPIFSAPTLIFLGQKKKKIAENPDRGDFRFRNGLKI